MLLTIKCEQPNSLIMGWLQCPFHYYTPTSHAQGKQIWIRKQLHVFLSQTLILLLWRWGSYTSDTMNFLGFFVILFSSRSLCPNLHITPTSSFIVICLSLFHWSSFSPSAPLFSCLAALFGYQLIGSWVQSCTETYTMGLCLGYCQNKGRLIFWLVSKAAEAGYSADTITVEIGFRGFPISMAWHKTCCKLAAN